MNSWKNKEESDMLERWCKQLVELGKRHPRLRWPLAALLALLYAGAAVWEAAKSFGGRVAAYLREAGLTPQSIHDHAERLLDAGIGAAKKLPALWAHVRQNILPLAMARGREAFHASRQWCLARCRAVKATLPVWGVDLKAAGGRLVHRAMGRVDRITEAVRTDLPEYKRHAPRRAMAAALALVMCLGLLPVSAFAAETDCNHEHDASCYRQELTCGKTEGEGHTHGPECYTDQPICGLEESGGHTHTGDCYTETQTCTLDEHTHGDACCDEAGELTCALDEHTHDDSCVTRELSCGLEESEGHTHGPECCTDQPVCGVEEAEAHSHTEDCYTEIPDCPHVHDETCGGLEEIELQCTCGAVVDEDGKVVHAEDCPLYEAPVTPECTCGAVPAEDGKIVHAEDCPLYEAPDPPECTCGAVPDEDGKIVHAEGCPLYEAPKPMLLGAPVTTLEDLKAALAAGGEITLGQHFSSVKEPLTVPESVSVTLDLAGYKIVFQENTTTPFTDGLTVNGRLTVTNSGGDYAEINDFVGGTFTPVVVGPTGKFTLEGGKVDPYGENAPAIAVRGGTALIQGGKVFSSINYTARRQAITVSDGGTLNISGGSIYQEIGDGKTYGSLIQVGENCSVNLGGVPTLTAGGSTFELLGATPAAISAVCDAVPYTGGPVTIACETYPGGATVVTGVTENNKDSFRLAASAAAFLTCDGGALKLKAPDAPMVLSGGTSSSGAGWSWDGKTYTLTLKGGFALDCIAPDVRNYDDIQAMKFAGISTIVLDMGPGETARISLSGAANPDNTYARSQKIYGINSKNDLTIKGTGTLCIENTVTGFQYTTGLGTYLKTLTVEGDAQVYAAGPQYGVYANTVKVRENGALYATADPNATIGQYKEGGPYCGNEVDASGIALGKDEAGEYTAPLYYYNDYYYTDAAHQDRAYDLKITAAPPIPLDDSVTGFASGATYTIDSEAQLANLTKLLAAGKNSTGCIFKLLNDISLDASAATDAGWTPIGWKKDQYDTTQMPFCGEFDGGGHTISNLKVNAALPYAGLFGRVGDWLNDRSYSGLVRDLVVEGAVVSSADGAGGLAGKLSGGSRVERCVSHVTVTSDRYNVGGLVGAVEIGGAYGANIRDCYATGDVIGTYSVGGIVGQVGGKGDMLSSSGVMFCYATGAVTATDKSSAYVGGIVGMTYMYYVTVKNCVALNKTVTQTNAVNTDYINRVIGRINSGSVDIYRAYNYARKDMKLNGATSNASGDAYNCGEAIAPGSPQDWGTWFKDAKDSTSKPSDKWSYPPAGATLSDGAALPTLHGQTPPAVDVDAAGAKGGIINNLEQATLDAVLGADSYTLTDKTIALSVGLVLDSPISFEGVDCMFDLNGQKITTSEGKTYGGIGLGDNSGQTVTTVTIKDTPGGGSVTGNNNGGGALYLLCGNENDRFTIEGGAFTGVGCPGMASNIVEAQQTPITVTISGGSFTGAAGEDGLDITGGGVSGTITGGTFSNANLQFYEPETWTVSGGTFTDGINVNHKKLSDILAPDYTFVVNGTDATPEQLAGSALTGPVTVRYIDPALTEARYVDAQGQTVYDTFENAVANVPNNGTVTVVKDVELDATVSLTKSLTLVAEGQRTIKQTKDETYSLLRSYSDTLTVGRADGMGEGNTLTIDGQNFTTGWQKGLLGGNIILYDGVTLQNGGCGLDVSGASEIHGGRILNNLYDGVCVNSGALAMSGGEIAGNKDCGIRQLAGAVTLSGGTIHGNGKKGAEVGGSNSTFEMTGGEIYGNQADGLYVNSGRTAKLLGGKIHGNLKSSGGGVMASGSNTIQLGGDIQIYDNFASGTLNETTGCYEGTVQSNLYFDRDTNALPYVTLTGQLGADSKIGLSGYGDSVAVGAEIVKGDGVYSITADDLSKFVWTMTGSSERELKLAGEGTAAVIKLAAVIKAPVITQQPAAQTSFTYGDQTEHKLIIDATSEVTYSFQWQKKGADDAWADVSEGDGMTLDLAGLGAGTHVYRCIVTARKDGSSKSVTSNEAVVTVTKAAGPDAVTVTPNNRMYDGTSQPAFTVTGAPAGVVIKSGKEVGSLTEGIQTATHATEGETFFYEISHANYETVSGNVTLVITPKQLTVTDTEIAATKVYDGTATAQVTSHGTLAGLENGETLTLTCTAAYGDKNVGEGKQVTLTYELADKGGAIAADYLAPADSSAIAAITAKGLTVIGGAATDRTYDGTTAIAITGGALSGAVENDAVTLSGAPVGSVADADIGSGKAVTVTGYTLTGRDAGNYALTQPAGLTVSIAAATPTLTLADKIASYTGEPINIDAATVAGVNGEMLSSDSVRYQCYSDADCTQPVQQDWPTAFGVYYVKASIDAMGNYTAASAVAKLTITYAPLPDGKANGDYFTTPSANGDGWYQDDITLTKKDTNTLSLDGTNFADTVVITGGDTADGHQTVYVKDSEGKVYQTTVDYKLDKTPPEAPTVTVPSDGLVGGWHNTVPVEITVAATDTASGVAKWEYSTDNGATWTDGAGGKFTIADDSTHQIVVKVTDLAGNVTTDAPAVEVKVDATAPTANLTGIPAVNEWTKDDVTITVNATDATAGLADKPYSFDGGVTWQAENSKIYTDNADGIVIQVKDAAGNVKALDTVNLTAIDKTAPAAPVVKIGGRVVTESTTEAMGETIDITLTPTPGSPEQYTYSGSKGGGTGDLTEVKELSIKAASGKNTLTITITDKAGNKTEKTYTVNITTAIPSAPAIDVGGIPGLDGAFTKDDVTVTLPTGDDEKYVCRELPDGEWKPVENGKIVFDKDSDSGKYEVAQTVTVGGTDYYGKPTEIEVKIDKTAPIIDESGITALPALDAPTNGNVVVTIPVADGDGGSGVKEITVNPSSTADVTGPLDGKYTVTVTENGSYEITFTDNAGNSSTTTQAVTGIDKTNPTVTVTPETDNSKWYGKTELTVTATDPDGSGVKSTVITVDGTQVNSPVSITEKGAHTLIVTVTDEAGNITTVTKLVNVDPAIDEFKAAVDGLGQNPTTENVQKVLDDYLKRPDEEKSHIQNSAAGKDAWDDLQEELKQQQDAIKDKIGDILDKANPTISDITTAEDLFELLDKAAQDQIDKGKLDQLIADRDAAQTVVDQIQNADTYEEQKAAVDAYDRLTEDQKTLADGALPAGTVTDMKTDVAAVGVVIGKIDGIKKPYTPATKDAIQAAKDAYDALNTDQKNLLPSYEKEKLDSLTDQLDHVKAVENKINALTAPYTQSEDAAIKDAQTAYNKLTADEKAMVDPAVKEKLDQLYQAMLDRISSGNAAADKVIQDIIKAHDDPKHTVEDIQRVEDAYNKLPQDGKDKVDQTIVSSPGITAKDALDQLVEDKDAVKDLVDDLGKLDSDKLEPGNVSDITDAKDAYDDLTEEQKKLVDNSTDDKLEDLVQAVEDTKKAEEAIEKIPEHSQGSTNTDGTPNLEDCANNSNANGDNTSTSGGHTVADHKKAIEDAKYAYELLSDAGRRLIDPGVVTKLNNEYKALMSYLEYINRKEIPGAAVEVVGLAEKVTAPTPPTGGKTIVAVELKVEEPPAAIKPAVPEGKAQALSVDVKLIATKLDSSGQQEGQTEFIQPDSGETVLVKLLLPTGYQLDTLEIVHVKDNGAQYPVHDFHIVTESDGSYAVFEVSSFSHFVLFAEKVSVPPTPPTPDDGGHSGGTVTPTPKPDVPSADHGSTTLDPQQPKPGTTVNVNPKPDDGYVVDKVIVTDHSGNEISVKDNGDGTWSYIQPKGKVTVTVTFKPASKDGQLPFADVGSNDWFYESVKYVYEKGLMRGTSDTTFSPYQSTSRGMIVTILWRLEGNPEAADAADFTDVAPDQYYTSAVAWGVENGIVKGYGNGSFGPNDPITREQLAAILFRYAQFRGMDTTVTGDLKQFSDQPSPWAAEAMRWAVGAGIISGKGSGVLDPLGKATRVEAAAMLMRFLTNLEK